jgi:hypothetical protein
MTTTDTDLRDRVAELERSTRRIIPAREGADGWANFVESRVAEESEFLRDVMAHAIAQLQREFLAECKALITEKLAQRIRGTFDPRAKYSGSDIVAMDGASFVARHDDPGACPGGGWQLLAKQGQRGPSGERGAPGRDAPRISGWIVDRNAFTVAPKFSDGTIGPLLELRALFEQVEDNTAA